MTCPSAAPRDRVLLVDDTASNIGVLMAALKDEYKLGVATSGLKTLEYVQRTPPDLILLDIMMPEMDGYEVCARLKGQEATRNIPVIFLTALTDVEEKVKGFALGAVDYVTKPFEIVEVQARVRTHLQLERLRRELAAQNRALAEAQGRLSGQIRELRGRDRLLRFQMTNDSAVAACEEIVGVLRDVLGVDRIVLYRPAAGGDGLEPRAALAAGASSGLLAGAQLARIAAVDLADGTSPVARAFRERRPCDGAGDEAAAPVLYGDEELGVIAAAGLPATGPERRAALDSLWRLAGEAAVVLRSAQVAEDLEAGRLDADDLIALADRETSSVAAHR